MQSVDSTKGVSRYVTKYCSKGVYENPKVAEGKVDKTFHLISKGIGYDIIKELKRSWYDKLRAAFPESERVGDFHGFNKDYIAFIVDNSKKFSDGKYVYTMPRYWSDAILLTKHEREKEV